MAIPWHLFWLRRSHCGRARSRVSPAGKLHVVLVVVCGEGGTYKASHWWHFRSDGQEDPREDMLAGVYDAVWLRNVMWWGGVGGGGGEGGRERLTIARCFSSFRLDTSPLTQPLHTLTQPLHTLRAHTHNPSFPPTVRVSQPLLGMCSKFRRCRVRAAARRMALRSTTTRSLYFWCSHHRPKPEPKPFFCASFFSFCATSGAHRQT